MKRENSAGDFCVITAVLVFSLLTSSVLFSSNRASARTNQSRIAKQEIIEDLGNMPVYFEENQGQFDEKVKYLARGTNGFSLFLTATDAVYVLTGGRSRFPEPKLGVDELTNPRSAIPDPQSSTAVYMSLVGGNEQAGNNGSSQLEHRTSYFKGSRENWRTEIPNYGSVRINGVYEGIDTVWHGRSGGGVQYDFIVTPGSNPEQIAWEVKGANSVELDAEGNLLIKTEYGDIKQNKPFTYQETAGMRREVESSFVLDANRSEIRNPQSKFVRFALASYDTTKPLVIDPSVGLSTLAYSTFLGGSGVDEGLALDVDNAGNVYVMGNTGSTAFPTTAGAFDATNNGGTDVFVTKLNATGTGLLYSTFLGGAGNDLGYYGIAVDDEGSAYVTGVTNAPPFPQPGFPTTPGAFDTTYDGVHDAFVAKLNASGSALVYSTLLGGTGGGFGDRGYAIAVDDAGNAFVTGGTFSTNFPTTSGAFDTTHNGGSAEDAFVAKLNPSGSGLVYSTYLGGENDDIGLGIALDGAGNAFVAGSTNSTAFPTTGGALDTTFNGLQDAFVTKLNAGGSALAYSTFLGGAGAENGFDIAIDGAGSAYVTGSTFSTNFPTTSGAFDTTANGSGDVFATKLNGTGSGLLYSTFIGGSSDEEGLAVAVDGEGNIFVTGYTNSGAFPTTAGAFDTTFNGGFDPFVTNLNATGSELIYSTFIGGSVNDVGYGIALDAAENAIVTGSTGSSGFPTTTGAFDRTPNGSTDAFVAKLGTATIVNCSQRPISDFDGDGRTDLSVFRPSDGIWYLQRSTAGFGTIRWGLATDRPVPGDYDGDGKADAAVFRPAADPANADYFILHSSGSTFFALSWGLPGDVPVIGDYDGDCRTDQVVFRPSEGVWYIRNSSDASASVISFGLNGDIPLAFDLENDGKTNLAVFRPSENRWYIARNNGVPAQNFESIQFGLAGDRLVPADYDGDSIDDLAVFRPSTGQWIIRRSSDSVTTFTHFGVSTDSLAPGDYDGDGRDDIAIYRSGIWWINRSTAGLVVVNFGLANDTPIPAKYIP